MKTRTWPSAWSFSAIAAVLLLLFAASHPVVASDSEIDRLRAEIDEMRLAYEERIAALESRLLALEGENLPASSDVDLEALRAAANDAVSQTSSAKRAELNTVPLNPQADLNRYNPEISVTGIILGSLPEGASGTIEAHEFELDLQSALDPFSKMRLTVAFAEGEAEIEEGFIRYDGIGGGLSLQAGRFRQSFGVLNRQHLHALPQIDYPLALSTQFGEEGLAQTGLSATWLAPGLWADANELTVQLTTGDNEAFSGADYDDPAVLAHLKNYWELSRASYFELGLSAIVGSNEFGDSEVLGGDLTLHWQPPSRAKDREVTWRLEILRSERENHLNETIQSWGGYSYLETKVARNLSLGLLYDSAEDPLEPSLKTTRIAPYLSWWQSEFVRLRFEGRYTSRDDLLDDHFEALLQLTFAAGPHKHESY